MEELPCPKCSTPTFQLQSLDPALRAKLEEAGHMDLPSQLCDSCYDKLASTVARGSVLMAREKAKEQKKMVLWRSRVNLIRKARQCMQDKMFSDAAVAYEKYIKVLELVFEAEPGTLSPDMFKESARTQELTVVASAYWDLLRIYDTSPQYGDRQSNAATKLSTFIKLTPIYPDIMRKARSFQSSAKNPSVVKNFIKTAGEEKKRCFIATAAFSEDADEVQSLQQFRDQYLLGSPWGRGFVNLYYKTSPPIADILHKWGFLRPPTRFLLRQIIAFLPGKGVSASRHKS